MGGVALSAAKYGMDFYQSTEQWLGNYIYKDVEGAEFMTNIFGEIAAASAGSIVFAKGNHYPGWPGEMVTNIYTVINQTFSVLPA